jgi:hypothetical protein
MPHRLAHRKADGRCLPLRPLPDDPLMIPSPNCPQCGAVTSLVSSFLDGGSGRRVRMFRCKCGEEIHTPVAQPDTEH